MADSETERLKLIEARLAKIEKTLGIRTPTQTSSSIVESKPSEVSTTKTPLQSDFAKPKPIEFPAFPDSGTGGLLGLIAIVCFILAAGFIVKLSIDTGWLTPVRQIGLAYLLGFVLIGAGFLLIRKDLTYASFLPAAGIIILFFTTFAAHQYYHLIPFTVALTWTAATAAVCIWLYWRFNHDLYAIIAATGAYLGPLLLNFHPYSIFTLYYFIVISFAFAMLSIWMRSRILCMIAAYLAILANAHIGFNFPADRLMAFVLAVHFIIFSVATYFYSVKSKQPLTLQEAWSFFPVLILFYVMEYNFIDRFTPVYVPWIALLFAVFLLCLYLSAKKWIAGRQLESESMILAFTTIVVFHSVYLELLPDSVKPWLIFIIALIFAFMPFKNFSSNNYSDLAQKQYAIPALALILVLLIEYLKLIMNLITQSTTQPNLLIIASVSFLSFWIYFFMQRKFISQSDEFGYAVLGATHLLAITGLFYLTTDSGSVSLSVSWLLYAIIVMVVAYVLKDKVMARSAVFILSFAAAKALLYDASAARTVVRIICLLITGAVLYGAGYLMRIISKWPAEPLSLQSQIRSRNQN